MRGSGQVLDDEIRNTGLQGRTDRLTPQGPQNSLPDTQSPKKKRNVHISSQIKHERFVLNLRAKKPPQVGGQGALGWGGSCSPGCGSDRQDAPERALTQLRVGKG